MIKEVLVHDNFLSIEECDRVLDVFNQEPFSANISNDIWANRVKHITEYGRDLDRRLKDDRLKTCEQYFNKKFKMINLNITIWNSGNQMPPHLDNVEHRFANRHYASLIYLNDGFEGGQLYIPQLRFELFPKKGQLVCFEGGKYLHGVREITKGTRITSICWFEVLDT